MFSRLKNSRNEMHGFLVRWKKFSFLTPRKFVLTVHMFLLKFNKNLVDILVFN